MTGGTLRHNRATLRSMIAFENHLHGKPCRVFAGDVKVAVNVAEPHFCPDVVVTRNAQDLAEPASIGWRGTVATLRD